MARKWIPASANPAEFDRQFAAGRQAGTEAAAVEPAAASAAFDPRDRTVTVHLRNGVSFTFPVARIPELAGRSDAELQAVRATPSGHGLHWDDADIHLAVPWLVAHLFGPGATQASGRPGGAGREASAIAESAAGQFHWRAPARTEDGHGPEDLHPAPQPSASAIREAVASGDAGRIREVAENALRWLRQNPGHESQDEVRAAVREMDASNGR